jgi:endonuclease/exonuclease/phosphatase family metal-dependent hydrolase
MVSGQFTTPGIRKNQIETYASVLDAGTPRLIAGDFNESENGSAVSWLESRGLHSAVPDFSHADTWSWQTSIGHVSRRFDHIVHSSDLKALSAGVVFAGRSDHLPVFAVLERAR